MGRESARTEAKFMKGDVGVDGGRTDEETRDPAELEKDKAREQLLRGRTYLGREFLTWLLWKSEAGGELVEHKGEGVTVLFMGRVVLRGLQGEVVELAAKGTLAPYSLQVRRALNEGLLVHLARARFTVGERTWEASLDAEFLDCKSAKLPELLTEEEDDRLSERLDLTEQLSAMLDALVESFLELRTSKAWNKDAVPKMKVWMQGENEGKTQDRARRLAS
ncbi:MAG: hypothetical protein ACT4TC_18910 [Myxococcaceae bacterium]